MKRVITALFLVPIAVYCALFAPEWLFYGVVALAAILCFREYSRITGAFAPVGYIAGLLMLVAPPHELVLLVILSTLAAMCLPLGAASLEKGIVRAAFLALGIIYVFGSWKTAILLHDEVQSGAVTGAFGVPAGRHWLMFGLMVNWVGDTGAYYVGKNFGRHKLAPAVSPGKSWEGAAASLVTAIVFGLVYLPLTIRGMSLVLSAILAFVANAAGQLGDLAESAIKRGVGVKDSGDLLPGHGGFLDRVDSTMFALPVLYAVLPLMY